MTLHTFYSLLSGKLLSGLVGNQVWHLITGCHLCVGSTLTIDISVDLFLYSPGCGSDIKTPSLTFVSSLANVNYMREMLAHGHLIKFYL